MAAKKPSPRPHSPAASRAHAPEGGTAVADDLGDDTLDFMRLLWSVDHGLQSTSKRMNRELGITGPQRTVVRMVGQFPGISAGALAQLMRLHPSTLTGILERLVTREVLSRSADPEDARRALFHLTKVGTLFNALQAGTVESVVREILAGVSGADLKAVKGVLQALAEGLKSAER